MAWTDATADGMGAVAWRLEGEGWPEVFVSDESMIGTQPDGRVRVQGLKRAGLGFRERLRMREGKIDFNGCTVTIADVELGATKSFTTDPTIKVWLGASVDDVQTHWLVSSSAGLNGLMLHIGTEAVLVTGTPDATHIDVTRAQWGTSARAHKLGIGDRLQYPQITNRPTIHNDRRWTLYAHTPTELATSNFGSVAFRGKGTGAPRSNGGRFTSWSFTLDHIGKTLDQPLGALLDAGLHFTGIYYAWSGALIIIIREGTTASARDNAHFARVVFTGRYETQRAFIAALDAALQTQLTAGGFTQAVHVVASGTEWALEVTCTGAPKMVYFYGGSEVDGLLDPSVVDKITGVSTDTLVAGGMYRTTMTFTPPANPTRFSNAADAAPRTVPRACYGLAPPGGIPYTDPTKRPSSSSDPYTSSGPYPTNIAFVDRTDLLSVGTSIQGGTLISAVDTTTGAIAVDNDVFCPSFAGEKSAPVLKPVVRFAIGNLADFGTALTNLAATGTPGAVPFFTATDGLNLWSAEVLAAIAGSSTGFFSQRIYEFRKATTVAAVVALEALLISCIPSISAQWRVVIRRLKLAAPTEALQGTLGPRVVSQSFGNLDLGSEGYLGNVQVQAPYDADADKFLGPPVNIRNPAAIEKYNAAGTLDISPKVATVDGSAPTQDDMLAVAWAWLAFLGEKYYVVDIPVTLRDISRTIGDVINVTVPQMPFNGARGLTAKNALVIGRDWSGFAEKGVGTVTVAISSIGVAGYAPTARVSSQVNNSGNIWTLTIDRSFYFVNATIDCFDHYAVGDKVRIIQWNSATPTNIAATVLAVTSTTIQVDFGASVWTPLALTWNLMFNQRGTDVGHQLNYGFNAQSDRTLASGVPAQMFSI